MTDYFPGIEGLVRLFHVTHDKRYLQQAERMAAFFQRFDNLPIDHSHGNLITQHGLLLLYEATQKSEYLQRARDRWQQAWEGGYVWPTGGVGEKFRVAWTTDEGCSEADWLRLSLELSAITGEPRYLQAAERLLFNHYEMNHTANGGFGHHNFVCDDIGPLLMQPTFTEAVWCCTFHGLVGLHTLKSHVVVGSARGVFINFPMDVSAPMQTAQGTWRVTLKRDADAPQTISCRVRREPIEAAGESPPPVFLRRPEWAEQVTVTDGRGVVLSAPCEQGYLQLPSDPAVSGEVIVTFAFQLRMEDRRLQPWLSIRTRHALSRRRVAQRTVGTAGTGRKPSSRGDARGRPGGQFHVAGRSQWLMRSGGRRQYRGIGRADSRCAGERRSCEVGTLAAASARQQCCVRLRGDRRQRTVVTVGQTGTVWGDQVSAMRAMSPSSRRTLLRRGGRVEGGELRVDGVQSMQQSAAVGDLDGQSGTRIGFEHDGSAVLVEHEIDADIAQLQLRCQSARLPPAVRSNKES